MLSLSKGGKWGNAFPGEGAATGCAVTVHPEDEKQQMERNGTMSDQDPWTGRCYCGALTFEMRGEPLFKGQCHCRECQYYSGGGPNYFMLFPFDAFHWITGSPKSFRRTDIEAKATRYFCEGCGTQVGNAAPSGTVVRVGCLDAPERFEGPDAAIYTCDAQPFHEIPDGLPRFDKVPKR